MSNTQSNEQSSGLTTRGSLVLRLKDGQNGDPWHEFHEIYGLLIFGYALRFDISSAEAEDIVQEVCIKVFRQIHAFDYSPQRGRFRGWLKAITRHTVIDYLRRKQHRLETSREYAQAVALAAEPGGAADDDVWRQEWEKAVYDAALKRVRQRVSEDTYRAFQHYVLEEQSGTQAANQTALDANGIYSVKHRMLKYIREEVRKILSSE